MKKTKITGTHKMLAILQDNWGFNKRPRKVAEPVAKRPPTKLVHRPRKVMAAV